MRVRYLIFSIGQKNADAYGEIRKAKEEQSGTECNMVKKIVRIQVSFSRQTEKCSRSCLVYSMLHALLFSEQAIPLETMNPMPVVCSFQIILMTR